MSLGLFFTRACASSTDMGGCAFLTTDCVARNSVSYGGFTLNDVLRQHIGSLGIPAFQGGFFGHVPDQFSLPQGVMAEIDATAGTIQLLEAAVI